MKKAKGTKVLEEINEIQYRQKLILSALRNLLEQNNPNGVNNYLISVIERAL